MGRGVGRAAEVTAGVIFWMLGPGCCCCCCWMDLVPSRWDAGNLCRAPGCCGAASCCVGCGDGTIFCCCCWITFCRCRTTVAFALATTLRLASIRICFAAVCPPTASSPWSDGRFVPTVTSRPGAVDDGAFAGGGAANLRARCSIFFLCSISSASTDCDAAAAGLCWLMPPDANLFL